MQWKVNQLILLTNIDQKIKSLYECFNGVKETEKSNEVLQENVSFLQNELIRKDEIIKSLFETISRRRERRRGSITDKKWNNRRNTMAETIIW